MGSTKSKPGAFYLKRTEYEKLLIMQAIATNPTHTAAAKSLGLTRSYFCRLMKQLGIEGLYTERRAFAEGKAGLEIEA